MSFIFEEEINKHFNNIHSEFRHFFDLKIDPPTIVFLKSRKAIDERWKKKTPRWLTAWTTQKEIFILDPNSYIKESDHHSTDHFWKTLRHEYSHIYFRAVTRTNFPKWLNEGLACYLAGRKDQKLSHNEYLQVFFYFRKTDQHIYAVANFWVDLFLERYGKKNFLQLLKTLHPKLTQKEFARHFFMTYGFHYSKIDFSKLLQTQNE